MYAVGEHLGLLRGYLAYGLGYGTIGQQHEFLDELMRLFGLLEVYAHGVSLLVNIEAHLHAVKVDGAIIETLCTELLSEVIEDEQRGLQFRFCGGRIFNFQF